MYSLPWSNTFCIFRTTTWINQSVTVTVNRGQQFVFCHSYCFSTTMNRNKRPHILLVYIVTSTVTSWGVPTIRVPSNHPSHWNMTSYWDASTHHKPAWDSSLLRRSHWRRNDWKKTNTGHAHTHIYIYRYRTCLYIQKKVRYGTCLYIQKKLWRTSMTLQTRINTSKTIWYNMIIDYNCLYMKTLKLMFNALNLPVGAIGISNLAKPVFPNYMTIWSTTVSNSNVVRWVNVYW